MLDLKTHIESSDVSGRRHVKLVKPYIRLHEEGGPAVFIQKGKFYGQGKRELRDKDLPDWLGRQLEATDREMLKQCGMTDTAIDKYIRESKKEEPKVEEAPKPRRGRPRKT